jgi:hypothetical protein
MEPHFLALLREVLVASRYTVHGHRGPALAAWRSRLPG